MCVTFPLSLSSAQAPVSARRGFLLGGGRGGREGPCTGPHPRILWFEDARGGSGDVTGVRQTGSAVGGQGWDPPDPSFAACTPGPSPARLLPHPDMHHRAADPEAGFPGSREQARLTWLMSLVQAAFSCRDEATRMTVKGGASLGSTPILKSRWSMSWPDPLASGCKTRSQSAQWAWVGRGRDP